MKGITIVSHQDVSAFTAKTRKRFSFFVEPIHAISKSSHVDTILINPQPARRTKPAWKNKIIRLLDPQAGTTGTILVYEGEREFGPDFFSRAIYPALEYVLQLPGAGVGSTKIAVVDLTEILTAPNLSVTNVSQGVKMALDKLAQLFEGEGFPVYLIVPKHWQKPLKKGLRELTAK